MRNLIIVLIASLFTTFSFAQLKTKKYLRANKTPARIIKPIHKSHSRALLVDKDRLLTGSADGSIYLIDLKTEQQQLLFQQPSIKEIRDIEKSNIGFIAMQSDLSSKLIQIRKNGDLKIDKNPLFTDVFLDGLDMNGDIGFLMGDPKDGYFSLFHTTDGGKNWQKCEGELSAFEGEAGYAASGTNVQLLNDSTFVFISGGAKSHFFLSTDSGKSWKRRELPYYPGKSTGPYSMCFANDSIGMMVGGDYKDKDLKLNTCFYTPDGGESWLLPENPTRGYRSCVIYKNEVFYTCGTNGIDVSINNGKDWAAFADGNYISLCTWSNYLIASAANGELHFFNLID